MGIITDEAQVKVVNQYGKFFFPQHGLKPCPKCGGVQGLHIDVSATGFSCGERVDHKPDCPTLFCEHGVRFDQDCPKCDDAATIDGRAWEDGDE